MTAAVHDLTQFAGLRASAVRDDPEALRQVAGQFEALFLQQMLKSMRDASLGDPLFGDSNQHEMYQEMFDKQIALDLATGKGIGLADVLVRQLGGESRPPYKPADRPFPLDVDVRPRSVRPSAEPGGFALGSNSEPEPTLSAEPTGGPLAVDGMPVWSGPDDFVAAVWPHAQRAAERLNVAPEGILAQAALETGWGAHVPQRSDGSSSFNLFGIKAGGGWNGDRVTKATLEFDGSAMRNETASFRAYVDVANVFDDYADFIKENPRYEAVRNHGDDVAGFASALQEAGYATDPDYASKIRRVAGSDTMQDALARLKESPATPITSALQEDSL